MRFLLLVGTLGLLAASLFLAILYGPAAYADVARLGHIGYYEDAAKGLFYLPLAFTPARFAALRVGLGALLGGSGLATLALLRAPAGRGQVRRLGRELAWAGAGLARTVRRLPGAQRAGAGLLLLLILAAQLLWFVNDPLSPDEILSYDSFVYEGPLAITAYYPVPNNHIFYNFLSWLAGLAVPGHARVAMRLPSLLAAVAATALGYALLTHFRNFRVATVVTALFSLTRLTVIYAASGRGYYLQMLCLELAFFATVGLATGHRCRRLAWAVLVGSSVVGLYTIPTYAAPLASLGLVLLAAGLGMEPRQRRRYWAQLAVAGALIGAVVLVLYAPVGAVSGWPRLVANSYLASNRPAAFGALVRPYLYETATMLLGPARPGLIASAALVGLAPLALWRARLAPRHQWLAWASWGLLMGPPVLMLGRQVFIPGRALMYTTFFFFLLAALGADYALDRWRGRWAAWLPAGLLGALLAFRVAELGSQVPALLQSRNADAAVARSYRWLRAQPPGPVFLLAPYHEVMYFHYALLEGRPLRLDVQPAPGRRYPYFVWAKGSTPRPAWASALPHHPAYEDAMAIIYTLAPTAK